VPLFAAAEVETIAHLTRATRAAAWDEGAELWAEGAPPFGAVLITGGLVEIARHLAGGTDSTVALFGPGELIGLTAALEDAPFPAAAIAVSDRVTGLVVAAVDLRAAVERDHGLARAANRALIEHAHVLQAKIAILTAGTVEARLAALIEHLGARFGAEADGAIRIPLTLTRRMLAQLVGARVETVIRVLGQWRRRKLIDAAAEIVVHDPAALHRLASEAP
jgi:CRP-like cAMP-binding protein